MKLDLPDGPLTEPLPQLRIGLLPDTKMAQGLIAERVRLETEKLCLLADHLGIPDGPGRWYFLALQLGRLIVPGLQEQKTKGRPKKWGALQLALLAVELDRLTETGMTQEAAARKLSQLEPWTSFVGKWDTDKSTTGSDPAQALLTEYKAAKHNKFTPVARDAYALHVLNGTLDEWGAFVMDAFGGTRTIRKKASEPNASD